MITHIQNSVLTKIWSLIILLLFLFEIFTPTIAKALTSGPSTPEIQSFEPASSAQMVDLFTGDFVYNIPIFEVPGSNGGYPLNLSYHSGIGMDQEASWVGLGWNLNPGVITRNMRGFPDDFDGDLVIKTSDVKPNITYGLRTSGGVEIIGGDSDFAISLGLKVYHNNYKGVGYSLFPSFGYSTDNSGIGMSVDFSFDTQEGVGANATVSYNEIGKEEGFEKNGGLSVGFNSEGGLNMGFNYAMAHNSKPIGTQSHNISFAQPAFTPTLEQSMSSNNLDIGSSFGFGLAGTYTKFTLGGFYEEQQLLFRTIPMQFKSYGYNNLQNKSDRSLLDFNRSKDGIIRRESPNLAIPILTYDLYNISGQGINAMFRPFRSDFGTVSDPYVESLSNGGSIGFEAGVPFHIGNQFTYTGGSSNSGNWSTPIVANFNFKDKASLNISTDPVYYKVHGEPTATHMNELAYIGGDVPVRAKLTGNDLNPTTVMNEWWQNENNIAVPAALHRTFRNSGEFGKVPTNTSVQPLSNYAIGVNATLMPVFNIQYFATNGTVENLDRFAREVHSIEHHIGGISAINADGMKYVYALPAYNLKDIEYTFSVPPGSSPCGPEVPLPRGGGIDDIEYHHQYTDEYFNKVELPPYAYAYHLTSILGSDYVDVDGDGPDNDDMGYWVKFQYEKQPVYGWRSPYENASYSRGWESTLTDNKASFKYGEKEVFYLKTIETNSHIAEFVLGNRTDAKGINLYGNTVKGLSKSLDMIRLHTKGAQNQLVTPVQKTAHFTYTNQLCDEIPQGSGTGKLTLTKLHFTHQNNTRGALNPYTFQYNGLNPDYGLNRYDRWGNYKPYNTALTSDKQKCMNFDFPYVLQFDNYTFQDNITKAQFKDKVDAEAAAWHLTGIGLPGKGKIGIEYESDDYAFVQHRKAGQMFQISRTEGMSSQNQPDWKVFFKLEYPQIVGEALPGNLYNDYLSDLKHYNDYQLYFKIRSNLTHNVYEYVSGYVNIDLTLGRFGYDPTTIENHNGILYYTQGFITLQAMNVNGNVPYHPFRVAAWQHMRTNQPKLMTTVTNLDAEPGTSDHEKELRVQSLMSIIPEILKTFTGYRQYCYNRGFAGILDNEKSIIRLQTPDGVKYGGGNRVKRITMNDGWNVLSGENAGIYGMSYEYTTTIEGKKISSGVAQYEPMIGGDEISLRHAKNYPEKITVGTNNNLFFEYPLNEASYPGPGVGYSEVSVKSLATENRLKNVPNSSKNVTGVQVHNFYTAREFPVITGETDIQKKYDKYTFIIPLIGQNSVSHLTASQGYFIQLNDMHGKMKSIYDYGINSDGSIVPEATQSVEYEYFKAPWYMRDGSNILAWKTYNQVPVTFPDPDKKQYGIGIKSQNDFLIGVEYDFFNDSRESQSEGYVGGIRSNIDIIIPPITIPSPWPTIVEDNKQMRTIATNKVIFASGIVKEVKTTNGLSMIKTENILFDFATGRPLLTKENNTYEKPLYKYSIPAYWNYEGMSGAYKNFGQILAFTLKPSVNNGTNSLYDIDPGDEQWFHQNMQAGDELLLIEPYTGNKGIALLSENFKGENGNFFFQIYSPNLVIYPNLLYAGSVVNPARKNMLALNAGRIVSMNDPTDFLHEPLSTQTIVNTPDDFVNFLNEEVLECDGMLKTNFEFDLNSHLYYDNNGFHKYPETKKILNRLTFMHCKTLAAGSSGSNYPHLCQQCQEIPNAVTLEEVENSQQGYDIQNIVLAGQNTPKYGNCECVAHKWDNFVDIHNIHFTPITNFSQSSVAGKILVNYENSNQTEFCVIPPGSGGNPGGNFGTCWSAVDYIPERFFCFNVLQAEATTYSDDWDYEYQNSKCNQIFSVDNPYKTGKRGIWRQYKTYQYRDKRYSSKTDPASLTASVDLTKDGVYSNGNLTNYKNAFYYFNWKPSLDRPLHEHWVITNEITRCDRNGFEVESMDMLGNYSTVVYDRVSKRPILSNQFGSYFNVFTHDAETDDLTNLSVSNGTIERSDHESHTGEYSWKIITGATTPVEISTQLYPRKGQTYFISLWVKYPNTISANTYSSNGIGLKINFMDKSGMLISQSDKLKPLGNIVEGWQKIEGVATAPSNENLNKIGLHFTSSLMNDEYFIDDIRITPFNGVCKTYVYNFSSKRLEAILDENNFAQTYHYNEQGNLFLIKKETVKGIHTVQENINHYAE